VPPFDRGPNREAFGRDLAFYQVILEVTLFMSTPMELLFDINESTVAGKELSRNGTVEFAQAVKFKLVCSLIL
jgi:hypothetical protein